MHFLAVACTFSSSLSPKSDNIICFNSENGLRFEVDPLSRISIGVGGKKDLQCTLTGKDLNIIYDMGKNDINIEETGNVKFKILQMKNSNNVSKYYYITMRMLTTTQKAALIKSVYGNESCLTSSPTDEFASLSWRINLNYADLDFCPCFQLEIIEDFQTFVLKGRSSKNVDDTNNQQFESLESADSGHYIPLEVFLENINFDSPYCRFVIDLANFSIAQTERDSNIFKLLYFLRKALSTPAAKKKKFIISPYHCAYMPFFQMYLMDHIFCPIISLSKIKALYPKTTANNFSEKLKNSMTLYYANQLVYKAIIVVVEQEYSGLYDIAFTNLDRDIISNTTASLIISKIDKDFKEYVKAIYMQDGPIEKAPKSVPAWKTALAIPLLPIYSMGSIWSLARNLASEKFSKDSSSTSQSKEDKHE